MAAYKVTNVETAVLADPTQVNDALEALLEALDSTTNPIRLIKVVPVGCMWKGVIIYDIP